MDNLKLILFISTAFFFNSSFGSNEGIWNITDFGAVPDGITLNTKAIQQAVDQASENGGGRVDIPPGNFLTGSIELKSNVELHLESGAVLMGSTSPYDYFRKAGQSAGNTPKTDDISGLGLILAVKAENIKLTGKGTIDGQGLALALNADSLHHAGILVDEHYNYRRMRPSGLVRPKLFRFLESKNITVKNLT